MKRTILKNAGCAALALAFLSAGCSLPSSGNDTTDDPTPGEPEVPAVSVPAIDDTVVTDLGGSFSYAGFDWETVSGAAGLTGQGYLMVSAPAEGIAIELTDSAWASLAEDYGENFFIEAELIPLVGGSGSNKNFGIASHISADHGGFYYAGVNFNGRTQFGVLPGVPKGAQFGSLISDPSYLKPLSASGNWKQFYRLRYEYNNGIISGSINGIACNKSGTVTYTVPAANAVTSPVSAGIYTNGDTFVMKTFKVGSAASGLAAIKLQTVNPDLVSLKENAASFVFVPDPVLTVRQGDEAIAFTVTALDDLGGAAAFTVESSDETVLSVTGDAAGFTVTPVAPGTAAVTVTNGSDNAVTRTLYYTVKKLLSYVDTDYEADSALYPLPGAAGVFEDDHLEIAFDSAPTLVEGDIEIRKVSDDTLADSVSIGSETDTIGGQSYTLKNFMVQAVGNKLIIKPHTDALDLDTEYYVAIKNNQITGTLNGKNFTGFDAAAKRWTFTTRSAPTVNPDSLTVAATGMADFRSLQAALTAASDGATIRVYPGTYYEVINYAGTNGVTIAGLGSAEYGADVVIKGINCNSYNGSSATRASFHWKGGNLILKNLTLQNAYDRNIDGTAQSEALYFDSTAYLAAYDCSFLGHQDTLLTKGRNWFYKCYIEGDTDFVWGYADACLIEESEIVQLDTSSDSVPASASYIFETRVGTSVDTATKVGKGYVLYNSALESRHPKSYFARRATAVNPASDGTKYYDQAAVINTTITTTGNGALNGGLWGYDGSAGNMPLFIAKDASGNMNVGWKSYGSTLDGSDLTVPDGNAWAGTMTAELYDAEYAGRNAILNRVFDQGNGTYANADALWDISALAADFNATADTSGL